MGKTEFALVKCPPQLLKSTSTQLTPFSFALANRNKVSQVNTVSHCCHASHSHSSSVAINSTTRIIITRATLHRHHGTLKSRLLRPVIKLIWWDAFNDHHNPASAQSDDRFIVKLTTPCCPRLFSLTATQNLPHNPHFTSWFQQQTLSNTDWLADSLWMTGLVCCPVRVNRMAGKQTHTTREGEEEAPDMETAL